MGSSFSASPRCRTCAAPGSASSRPTSCYTVAAIVAAELVPMTAIGIAATLASGVYTAFFAWLQYLGVRRLAA